jgi:hypothetical protein
MNSVYLNMLLMGLIGSSELVEQWWLTPNAAFDYACPKDVDETKVKQYLEGFAYK